MVARVAEDADFIFDLHHQNGVVVAVDFFEVLHDGGEGAGVGVLGAPGRERAEDVDWDCRFDGARETVRILLDPYGRVAGFAVLP